MCLATPAKRPAREGCPGDRPARAVAGRSRLSRYRRTRVHSASGRLSGPWAGRFISPVRRYLREARTKEPVENSHLGTEACTLGVSFTPKMPPSRVVLQNLHWRPQVFINR